MHASWLSSTLHNEMLMLLTRLDFQQATYSILTEEVLKERQGEAVDQVTALLGISDGDAEHILRQYKW